MIDKLKFIIGVWKGKGLAQFPTIGKTEYIEEIEFKFIGDDESIAFEQKSWRVEFGKQAAPLHWESGYIIDAGDGVFELFNAQNSRRVEVMTCKELCINEDAASILFESKFFANDEKMVRTTREFVIKDDSLHYSMKMSTRNTPEFQEHLNSRLNRVEV